MEGGVNIDLSEVYVGQEVRNYFALCDLLRIEPHNGNQKKCQLKEVERYIKYEKDGHKFIILEIYERPLPKEDKRKLGINRGNYTVPSKNYLVNKDDNDSIGVYKIQLHNQVYIGSTIAGFRRRYTKHVRNFENLMPHTQELLKKGASFSILWKAENGESEEEIRNMEQMYLDDYKSKGYEIKNGNENVIIPGQKKTKRKKIIKVMESDYEIALNILAKNGIKIA